MEKRKQIPLGIDDFKKVREKNRYFVDKSLLIKHVIENASEVILFTRPRRFGKTLNFSMLRYFFERPACRQLTDEDRDYQYLFLDLEILKEIEVVEKHLGAYPLINLSFKKVKANCWQDADYLFKEEISREYNRHRYLLDAVVEPVGSQKKFERIMNMEGRTVEYTAAIADLSRYLSQYHSSKAIVLIDEYDTPLHYAKINDYYDEMLNTMRALLVDGLKGNVYLEKGIVTGIMKISQESIFSAFNNPKIAAITDSFCSHQFGFTEEEVFSMLDYYGMNTYQEIVKSWYDGYLFGTDCTIYNPWSVLSFIEDEDHVPKTYWSNTGDVSLIKTCLQLHQTKSKAYLKTLIQGESIVKEIEENIVYDDVLNNVDKAFSYLLYAGYLKAQRVVTEEKYLLSIPNYELTLIYKTMIKNWFTSEQKTSDLVNHLLNSLLSQDMVSFEYYLSDILLINTSYYDTVVRRDSILSYRTKEKENYENFYHGLILGLMLYLSEDYYLESNKEYELGRPDIVILPKDVKRAAYLFEFKNVLTSSNKRAKEASLEALQQIIDKEYEKGVLKTGVNTTIKIGLGFKGKEVAMSFER